MIAVLFLASEQLANGVPAASVFFQLPKTHDNLMVQAQHAGPAVQARFVEPRREAAVVEGLLADEAKADLTLPQHNHWNHGGVVLGALENVILEALSSVAEFSGPWGIVLRYVDVFSSILSRSVPRG